MKIVGLLGGAFDPPHHGHVMVMSNLLNSGLLDELWIVPSGVRKDKSYHVATNHRVAMVQSIIQKQFKGDSLVKVNLAEIENESLVGTVELLDYLKKQNADVVFKIVCGEELIKDFSKWRHAERLKKEAEFLIVKRPPYDHSSDDGYNITWFDMPCVMDVSSTLVRKLLAENKVIAGVLPYNVIEYIKANALYRES